jgi:hypothetical protein
MFIFPSLRHLIEEANTVAGERAGLSYVNVAVAAAAAAKDGEECISVICED